MCKKKKFIDLIDPIKLHCHYFIKKIKDLNFFYDIITKLNKLYKCGIENNLMSLCVVFLRYLCTVLTLFVSRDKLILN